MTVAVVTGAASGIGRALATQLAAEGHRVHLADREPTSALAAELGGVSVTLDAGDPDDLQRLAASAPGARVVCLDAGIVGAATGAPWEVDPAEWRRVLDTNLGVVNGLRAFVPPLLASGEPAQVLITASLAGLLTVPGGGACAASTHAVVAVAEQAALALAGTNVSVTVVCPALVRSDLAEAGADAAEVAAEALAAARSGRFLVLPTEWSSAVLDRVRTLVSGSAPQPATPSGRVRQMRLVVEADDYEDAVRFYRDRLGAATELQVHGEHGEKVTILDVGRATLELSNPEQVAMIDQVEVGRRVAPRLRVAFEVTEVDHVTDELTAAGAELVAAPTLTPWASRNARLHGPAGLQLTLFEELG